MKLASSFLLLGAFAHASPQYGYGSQPACPADKCFSSIRNVPKSSAIAYSFCKNYITGPTSTSTVVKTTTQTYTTTPKPRHVVTQTVSATQTSTATATPAQNTVTQLVTATSTASNTVTPGQNTVTQTISVTTQETTSSVCATTTVTSTLPTSVLYRVRGTDPEFKKRDLEERYAPAIPKELSKNCGNGQALKAKMSSACACFLPKTYVTRVTSTSTCKTTVTAPGYGYGYGVKSTVTTTVTSATVTSTVTASAPVDATFTTTVATNTVTATVTASQPSDATVSTTTTITSTSISCQTSTATTFTGNLCGPVTATTYTTAGTYTCTQSGIAPGATNNRFRIEGGSEGNIYDGCIVTSPGNITTPSGGTHLCDGTNNNANPAPGGTFSTDINDAGQQEGFDFDGTYSNQFQDFFITRVSQTTQTGNQFWGLLRNRVFTARGGCQEQVSPNDEALWAFDAFAANRVFLSLDRDFAVVRPGDTVSLTVLAGNPNSGNTIPASGATLGNGAVAGSDGAITFTAPTMEGCYLYKAERTNAIRSNAFYLSVVNSFGQ